MHCKLATHYVKYDIAAESLELFVIAEYVINCRVLIACVSNNKNRWVSCLYHFEALDRLVNQCLLKLKCYIVAGRLPHPLIDITAFSSAEVKHTWASPGELRVLVYLDGLDPVVEPSQVHDLRELSQTLVLLASTDVVVIEDILPCNEDLHLLSTF